MAKKLQQITVSDALLLEEDGVVILHNSQGVATAMAYRSIFGAPNPNPGKWGWIIGRNSKSDEEFSGQLARDARRIGELPALKGRRSELFEALPEHEGRGARPEPPRTWKSSTLEALTALPVGSVVELRESRPLGVKVSENCWITPSRKWISDSEAEEGFLGEAHFLMAPEH